MQGWEGAIFEGEIKDTWPAESLSATHGCHGWHLIIVPLLGNCLLKARVGLHLVPYWVVILLLQA